MKDLIFVKKKIMLFAFSLFIGILASFTLKTLARDNAFLACFIDEHTKMYKTAVLFSGQELERNWVTMDWDIDFLKDNYGQGTGLDPESFNILNINFDEDNFNFESLNFTLGANSDIVSIDQYGKIKLHSEEKAAERAAENKGEKKLDSFSAPMTFPSIDDARTADINRAYEVEEAISGDFNDALLFINGGKNFTSVDALIETAYYLVCVKDGGMIFNQYKRLDENNPEYDGAGYLVRYNPSTDGGMTYTMTITHCTDDNGEDGTSRTFVWKVRKGYMNCKFGDEMQNGNLNTIAEQDTDSSNSKYSTTDTEYITWKHLFLEAGTFYAHGITYSTQADVYATSSLESGLVSTTSNLLNGLRNLLQLYSLEDCIFNNGIRGSNAYAFGVYYQSWNNYFGPVFMIFVAIALSLVMLSLIITVIKKQYATVSPAVRASLIDGVKDLIVAIVFVGFSWLFCRIVLYINYQFTEIWGTYIGNKSLSDIGGGNSTLAAIVFKFAYFIICCYINIVYILRGISVAALMVSSPLFIMLFAFGEKGKKITGLWLKEFIGLVFIQSIHSFVLGFVFMCSAGLRGIESIVICAAVIPLTSMYKNIVGIDGDAVLRTASALTAGGAVAMGTVASGVGNVAGNALSGIGNNMEKIGENRVSGGNLAPGGIMKAGGIMAKTIGGSAKAVGGLGQMGFGAGVSLGLGSEGGHTGTIMMNNGAGQFSGGLYDAEMAAAETLSFGNNNLNTSHGNSSGNGSGNNHGNSSGNSRGNGRMGNSSRSFGGNTPYGAANNTIPANPVNPIPINNIASKGGNQVNNGNSNAGSSTGGINTGKQSGHS